jgi:hypothetical protein
MQETARVVANAAPRAPHLLLLPLIRFGVGRPSVTRSSPEPGVAITIPITDLAHDRQRSYEAIAPNLGPTIGSA